MDKQLMSIAILGTRGIPNRYGGFEACAEELALRLVKRGHQLSVYCVDNHTVQDKDWKGISRVMIKDPEKSLGTAGQFIYDLNCNRHSRKHHFDIVLHLGYTSDSVWRRFWDPKSIHITNMDGQEWKRQKFSRHTRRFLKYAEKLAVKGSKMLVADSPVIREYLEEKYSKPVKEIAYGAHIPKTYDEEILKQYDVSAGKYDMILARMEPENNIEMIINAKVSSKSEHPLLIIGNENKFSEYLKSKYGNESLIRFQGPVYDTYHINNLRHYSRYYIHGHSVGGTNPSLLEAMACSCSIIAHNNPFNAAVLNNDALYFSTEEELSAVFFEHPAPEFVIWQKENINKIRNKYNWDLIADAYEQLFRDALST